MNMTIVFSSCPLACNATNGVVGGRASVLKLRVWLKHKEILTRRIVSGLTGQTRQAERLEEKLVPLSHSRQHRLQFDEYPDHLPFLLN